MSFTKSGFTFVVVVASFFLCIVEGMQGVAYTTFIVHELNSSGISIGNAIGCATGAVASVLFALHAVQNWCAKRPKTFLYFSTATEIIVALLLLTSLNVWVYVVLVGSSTILFIQAWQCGRRVLINRIFIKDASTHLFQTTQIPLSIGFCVGSLIGGLLPATATVLAIESMASSVIYLVGGVIQIMYLNYFTENKLVFED